MKKKVKDFGEQFLIDYSDANLEFYWSIDVRIEIPKNRVLTGITQSLQQLISLRLYVGEFKNGIMYISTSSKSIFRELCERSPSNPIIKDNNGNSYTGDQFLSIINLCEII